MKKFLSLVLALVMTMSLVTISAGATEYKDLTDKSEITYEEAVAIMNKIGIISGYEDGSFKPTATLTRGAAAKIITYMMLGTVAAEQLGVAGKPYKDVALDNTFAPYIAYCKSTGLINGYSDGTFRPGAPLDGYSFSKMLMTALGYKTEFEGFTGSGWQTRVASIAVKTGLYAGKDAFVGSAVVTREEACLYAFNTLKATEVEYAGLDISVTSKDTNVQIGNSTASFVTNDKQASLDKTYNNVRDGLTQFCEEHFTALKLINDGTATDDFGRPSNKWAFKKATIGTYAMTPDFSFTAGTGDSGKDENYNAKAFGLKGYKFAGNGVTASLNGAVAKVSADKTKLNEDGYMVNSFAELSNLSANGTIVEIFTDADAANTITDIIVIDTQLMQVGSVNSSAKTVTLKKVEDDPAIRPIELVKEDAAGYAELSAMKSGDLVVITPVASGTKWEVASVVVPTTVTGKLSKVDVNKDLDVVGVTVAGTDYAMSYNWTAADGKASLDTTSVNTKRDATAYVDAFGYVIYMKDIVASTSFILYDDTYASVIDGKIHYFLNGYDMSGNALSLDFGTVGVTGAVPGTVYAYTAATKNSAEYTFGDQGRIKDSTAVIAAGASNIAGDYFASGVKFIFANMDGADLDGITVKEGVQEVKTTKGGIQYVMNGNGTAVTAVVVGNDKDVEVSKNILYVSKYLGTTTLDGKTVSRFDAYIDGTETKGLTSTKNNTSTMEDKFFTYAVDANNNYVLSDYNTAAGKATSVLSDARFVNVKTTNVVNKAYVKTLTNAAGATVATNLKLAGAQVIDLTKNGTLQSFVDMAEYNAPSYTVSLIYNDGNTSARGTVSYVFIKAYDGAKDPVNPDSKDESYTIGKYNFTNTTLAANGALRTTMTYERPVYAVEKDLTKLTIEIYADGNYAGTIKSDKSDTYDLPDTFVDGKSITLNTNIGSVFAGQKITLKVTNAAVQSVKVLYVDGDNKIDLTDRMITAADATVFAKTVAEGTDLKFQVETKSNTTPTLKYTISGTDIDATTKTAFATNNNGSQAVPKCSAAGNDYVTVTVYGLKAISETFTVKAKTADADLMTTTGLALSSFVDEGTGKTLVATTDGALLLKLTATPAADIALGDNVVIKMAMTANTAWTENFNYAVTLKLDGKTYGPVALNLTDKTTAVTLATIRGVNKNLVIAKEDITITVTPKLNVVEATSSWTKNTITLTFNQPIDPVTGSKVENYTFATDGTTLDTAVVDGNTVTLNFSGKVLAENDEITATNAVLSKTDAGNKSLAKVVTLAAAGKVTVA